MATHLIEPSEGLPCDSSELRFALDAHAPGREPLPRFAIPERMVTALGSDLVGAVEHELRLFELGQPMAVGAASLPAGRYLAWATTGIDRTLTGDEEADSATLLHRVTAAGAPAGAVNPAPGGRVAGMWAAGEGHVLLDISTRSITGGPGAELTVRYASGRSGLDGAPITVAGSRDLRIGLVPAWVPPRIALVLGATALAGVAVREAGLDGWSAEVIGATEGWQERLEDGLVSSGYGRSTEEIGMVDGQPVQGVVLRLERAGEIVTVTLGDGRVGVPIELQVTRQRGIS